LAWTGDARVRLRTQASLAVSADSENWLLINASQISRSRFGNRRCCIRAAERAEARSGEVEAQVFMVPGKLPLYLEGENPETASETVANVSARQALTR
jgi:hypothetical protein